MRDLWELLTELFSFFGKIAQNKGQKIPIQAPKIKAKADRKAGNIQATEDKKDWTAWIKNQPIRHKKRLKKYVRNLIEWGAEIQFIEIKPVDDKDFAYIKYFDKKGKDEEDIIEV